MIARLKQMGSSLSSVLFKKNSNLSKNFTLHRSFKNPNTSIAVIIPVYRDAHFLKSAILSVLNQTQCVNEIIIVNDCSPESELIESIVGKFDGITYIKNSVNLGLAAARNIGVNKSRSDIVSFLDADDELHPQAVELRMQYCRKSMAITYLTSRFSEETIFQKAVKSSSFPAIKVYKKSSQIIFRNMLTGAGLMILKEDFKKIAGYDENLKSCEDFDLWLRLLDAGVSILSIQLPLYFYRINPAGLSMNATNISYWEMQVVNKYLRRSDSGRCSEGAILSVWVLRQIFRYELSGASNAMRKRVNESMSMLKKYLFFYFILWGVFYSGLARLVIVFIHPRFGR